MQYLFVGLAGALGASLRYALGFLYVGMFPMITLLINLIGSLLLGWLTSFLPRVPKVSANLATAMTTGFLGAFTTFSTFSVDNVTLWRDGHMLVAASYIMVSLVGGFICAFVGLRLGAKGASV